MNADRYFQNIVDEAFVTSNLPEIIVCDNGTEYVSKADIFLCKR